MPANLALALQSVEFEPIEAMTGDSATLESLKSVHGMPEMAASILPNGCCSCSIACCCC
jgi:hypothetical protein